jgi:hypothetical protein
MLVAHPPDRRDRRDRRDRQMRVRRDLVSYLNVTLNFAFQQSLNCELLSYRFAFANELQILVFITHSKIFHSNPEYKIGWLDNCKKA